MARIRSKKNKKAVNFAEHKVILVPMTDEMAKDLLAKKLKKYNNKLGTPAPQMVPQIVARLFSSRRYKKKLRYRKFGTIDRRAGDGGPNVYYVPASLEPGQILMASNAFSWMGDPQQRALSHSSG